MAWLILANLGMGERFVRPRHRLERGSDPISLDQKAHGAFVRHVFRGIDHPRILPGPIRTSMGRFPVMAWLTLRRGDDMCIHEGYGMGGRMLDLTLKRLAKRPFVM